MCKRARFSDSLNGNLLVDNFLSSTACYNKNKNLQNNRKIRKNKNAEFKTFNGVKIYNRYDGLGN